jgi:uncharacterized membrane protein YkvA (DUF1232 family)
VESRPRRGAPIGVGYNSGRGTPCHRAVHPHVGRWPHVRRIHLEITMFKRLALLWSLVKGDARLMWRALRHPQSPGWLKLGALGVVLYVISPIDLIPDVIPIVGVLDDIVLVPLAIRWLLNRLPAALRADIGAGQHTA